MEGGVYIISKREVVENFPFLNVLYFSWTAKNGKYTLFFVDRGSVN